MGVYGSGSLLGLECVGVYSVCVWEIVGRRAVGQAVDRRQEGLAKAAVNSSGAQNLGSLLFFKC